MATTKAMSKHMMSVFMAKGTVPLEVTGVFQMLYQNIGILFVSLRGLFLRTG